MAKINIVFEDVVRDDGKPGVEIDIVRADEQEDKTIATELAAGMMATIESMIEQVQSGRGRS